MIDLLDQENRIMNDRIDSFNQFVMEQEINKLPAGLYYGRMGLCIYFYQQYRYSSNKIYKRFAEKLLDSVYDIVNDEFPIDIELGLSGICWGIIYLIENKFAVGNPNYILKEFDDKILQSFPLKYLNKTPTDIKSILQLLFYFSKRLDDKRISKDERYLFENYLIKGINSIEESSHNEKFSEAVFFSFFDYFLPLYLKLLYHLYEKDFYNYKIEKIFDELAPKIRSIHPLLGSNRLYLCCEMEKITRIRKLEGWTEHINILKQNIVIEEIILKEFRNKNILLGNGLSGFYNFLNQSELRSNHTDTLIVERIVDSDFWEILNQPEDLKKQVGLINGLSGVILTYQDIVCK